MANFVFNNFDEVCSNHFLLNERKSENRDDGIVGIAAAVFLEEITSSPNELIRACDDVLNGNRVVLDLVESFMNQPLQNLNFIELSPVQKEVIRAAILCLPLITRFLESHHNVLSSYQPAAVGSYAIRQMKYAEACQTSIFRVSQNMTLRQKFEIWSHDRANFAKEFGDKAYDSYSRFRSSETKSNTLTPIKRYPFIRSQGKYSIEYAITWKVDALLDSISPQEKHCLTRLCIFRGKGDDPLLQENVWVHTSPKTMLELLPHLEELHDALRLAAHDVTQAYATNDFSAKIEIFFKLLTHVYWLSVHLTQTHRGNAQYCQNLLYQMLVSCNLPPLIPKKSIAVDCIALSTTLETFQLNFFDYFEPIDLIVKMIKKFDPLAALDRLVREPFAETKGASSERSTFSIVSKATVYFSSIIGNPPAIDLLGV